MHDTIQAVLNGDGAIALVVGEVGIGKTSFVTTLVGSFRLLGRVLWGACDPRSKCYGATSTGSCPMMVGAILLLFCNPALLQPVPACPSIPPRLKAILPGMGTS